MSKDVLKFKKYRNEDSNYKEQKARQLRSKKRNQREQKHYQPGQLD